MKGRYSMNFEYDKDTMKKLLLTKEETISFIDEFKNGNISYKYLLQTKEHNHFDSHGCLEHDIYPNRMNDIKPFITKDEKEYVLVGIEQNKVNNYLVYNKIDNSIIGLIVDCPNIHNGNYAVYVDSEKHFTNVSYETVMQNAEKLLANHG
tara:strand:+ start:406 stop:855 length:450 start_codon:yes stop_codon:yes gene_type:complete